MKGEPRVQIDRIVLAGFDEDVVGRVRLRQELETSIAKLLHGPAPSPDNRKSGPDPSVHPIAPMVAGAIQQHAGLRGPGGAR